jgi:hypothetical protein
MILSSVKRFFLRTQGGQSTTPYPNAAINTIPVRIIPNAKNFCFVTGSLKNNRDQSSVHTYPNDTIGYSTESSPFLIPATKNTLDIRNSATPNPACQLMIFINPDFSFSAPIFKNTAPKDPKIDAMSTSTIELTGVFIPESPRSATADFAPSPTPKLLPQ